MRRLSSILYIITGALHIACQERPKSKDYEPGHESAPSERCAMYETAVANLSEGDGTLRYIWTQMITYKEMFGSLDQSSAKDLLNCLKYSTNESIP